MTGSRVVPAVVLVLAAALLLPGLWIGPSLDASVFSVVGWRLAEGDVPYVDIWDHKPPGVYLPYVVAQILTGDPDAAWRVIWAQSVASIVIAAIATWYVLRRAGASDLAAAAAAVLTTFGAGAYLLSLGGGMGETFALAPMALAVAALAAGRWWLAGALAGLAITISLQAAPVVIFLAALAMLRGISTAGRGIGSAAGGAAMVAAVAVAALAVQGALEAGIDAVVGYGGAYRAVQTDGAAGSVWSLVPWAVLVLLPLLLGAGLAVVGRRKVADTPLAVAAAIWLVAGLVLIGLQGRFYAHYATPLVVPLAILVGLGLDAALRSSGAAHRAFALAPLGIAVGVALVVGAAGAADEERMIVASSQRIEAVAAELDGSAGDSLLLWGNDARLHEVAGLRPATRYPYLYPMLTPGYVTPTMVEALLDGLEADPPRYVVDSGSLEAGAPGLPPLLIDRPVTTDGRNVDLLDPIREFISARYAYVKEAGGWPLYRLME